MNSPPEPQGLAELDRLVGLLAAAVELVYVRRPLETVLGDDEEVTAAQLRTLNLLGHVPEGGAVPVGAIGEGLRISYPAASKAVDRLAERGLAGRRRDPRDARLILVFLTPLGRDVVARVAAERRRKLAATLRDLGAPAADLERLLAAFLAASLADPRDRAEVEGLGGG